MKHYHLTISGMGCAHCVKSVTEALVHLGAEVAGCEIGRADVLFDGDVNRLAEAIADRGFELTAITEA